MSQETVDFKDLCVIIREDNEARRRQVGLVVRRKSTVRLLI